MKIEKLSFLLFLVGLSLPSLGSPNPSKWTVLLYMAGDNDLEPSIVSDLENEIGSQANSAQVQVLALADRIPGFDSSAGNWTSTLLFHAHQGMRATPENALENWGELNMGDPETLRRFVLYAKKKFPAERYALYFWGHGQGWRPGHLAYDQTNQDALEWKEIESILPSLSSIHLVGFDACNMASIETAFVFQNTAEAITFSQEYVDWEGLNYREILGHLNRAPHSSAEQLAIISAQSATKERTWSALRLGSHFSLLVERLAVLWSELEPVLLKSPFQPVLQTTQRFTALPNDLDLKHFLSLTREQNWNPSLKLRSEQALMALNHVILTKHHKDDLPQAHGVSIYGPSPEGKLDPQHKNYLDSLFSKATGWGRIK